MQKIIYIDKDAYDDLMSGNSGNPICEMELKEEFEKTIKEGGRVIINEVNGTTYDLQITSDRQFKLK